MAFNRQSKIIRPHTRPVIGDTDEAAPAIGNHHLDGCSPRIQGVFDQLFGGRGRTFDDLARRYAVDQNRIESANRHSLNLTKKQPVEDGPVQARPSESNQGQ